MSNRYLENLRIESEIQERVINDFITKVKISNPEEPEWKVKSAANSAIELMKYDYDTMEDVGIDFRFSTDQAKFTYWAYSCLKFASFSRKSIFKSKPKFKLKQIAKIIILLQQMQMGSIERIWSPGGLGYQQAFSHFNSLKVT